LSARSTGFACVKRFRMFTFDDHPTPPIARILLYVAAALIALFSVAVVALLAT